MTKSLEEAAAQYRTFTQQVKLPKCRRCQGSGKIVAYLKEQICPTCFGTGKSN